MLLTREQLQERLIALHRASLELVKDVSLDHLLKQIATLACEQAEAHYAALGVLDDEGKLDKFISVGMSEDEIKRIPHPPLGHGLIGELMGAAFPSARAGHSGTSAFIRLPTASPSHDIIPGCANPGSGPSIRTNLPDE